MRLSAISLITLLTLVSCNKGDTEIETGSTTQPGWSWYTSSTAQLSLKGDLVTIAGYPTDSGFQDDFGSYASFNSPNGLTNDGSFIYVADNNNQNIRKIDIATSEVTTIAGHSMQQGNQDGPGYLASFSNPWAITTDGVNLYVSDSGSNIIRKIVIATGEVSTIAGSTILPASSADGNGSAARFDTPQGIVTDGVNLYISDSGNHTIRKMVLTTGQVSTFAGSPGQQGSTDGIGSSARFNYPDGLTLDSSYLYVADTMNNVIRRIELATRAVRTIAGDPAQPLGGHIDARGRAALFNTPWALANDLNYLYVGENNCTIRKINKKTWDVTTITGVYNSCANVDGAQGTARLESIYGLTIAGQQLYFTGTSVIRRAD